MRSIGAGHLKTGLNLKPASSQSFCLIGDTYRRHQPTPPTSKIKSARIARAILSTEGVVVEKATKARLTQQEAATIIRQYQLGRTTKFKFSRLVIRKFNTPRARIDYKIRSWRVLHTLINPISLFVEIKSKRRGGRVFSVPVPIKSIKRRHSIFIH